MERAVEEVMQRVRTVYEMVTGTPAPEFSPDNPYARIPPEVDREEYVLRQAAALFERVRGIDQKSAAPQVGSDVVAPTIRPFAGGTISSMPVGMYREDQFLRFVFDVGRTSRERISVELQGNQLRVTTDRSETTTETQTERERFTQTAYLPVRVEPSAVTTELTDSFLNVSVRMPIIDDAIHKIEIR
jgi:HSP20 family molecular chaperone IbpA